MKIIQKIKTFFNPCNHCREKEDKGLVACSCKKGLFVKKKRYKEKKKCK
jgi:hypothetical protein